MGTELILPGDTTPLQLPDARNKGAEYLWTRLARIPDWLPQGVAARQFIMAVTAEANALPADTEPSSIVATAFNCAVVGLIPGKALMHAHFVTFKHKGVPQAQLIIGYRGFLELAYGCKFLKDVQCEVVLQDETYRRWNDSNGARIEHELPIDRKVEYAAVQAAYCIWHGVAGGTGISIISRRDLDKVKDKAEKKYGSVWKTDPIAMALKTPIRRAASRWKMTDRMGLAVALDGLAAVGEPQPILVPDDDEPSRPSLTDIPDPDEEDLQDEPANVQTPRGDATAKAAQERADELATDPDEQAKVLEAEKRAEEKFVGPDDEPSDVPDDQPDIVRHFLQVLSEPDAKLDAIVKRVESNIQLTPDQRKTILDRVAELRKGA